MKAIYLFPKKPSLSHGLLIPFLGAKFVPDTGILVHCGFMRSDSTLWTKITKVKLHFWLLKEKGKFHLKLLFASFSPRMIWFGLLESVEAKLSYNI